MKLLAVTAFCHTDHDLLLKRVDYMKKIGVQPTHDLLLVGDYTISENQLEAMVEAHKGLFKEVYGRRIKEAPSSHDWPKTVNHVWRIVVRLVAGQYGNPRFPATDLKGNYSYVGWFYFEPDVTPLNPQFLGILEQQYLFHKKPFMGVVHGTMVKTGENKINVDHMNGAAIYPVPTQYYSKEAMLEGGLPWDVAGFAGITLQQKVASVPSSVFVMAFGTRGYSRNDDGSYSATKTRMNGFQEPVTVRLGNALVHHGCKDGSLIDLLVASSAPKVIPPILPTGPALPKITIPERKTAPKKNKKEKLPPSSPEEIRQSAKDGMKWKDLIRTHRVMPKELKRILESA